jgi:dihydroorotate dehydrogenase (NAD+) catalytic subunit
MIDLAPQNPYNLMLTAPLVASSGAVGYGVEVARQLGLGTPQAAHGLGAIITRTLVLHGRRTTPPTHLIETPSGLLYQATPQAILRTIQERYAPIWASWANLAVIVSVAGSDVRDLVELVGALEQIDAGGVAGIELSLALSGALTHSSAEALVRSVRRATLLPLIVKLPLDAPELIALAQAVIAAGADTLDIGDGPQAASMRSDGTLLHGRLAGPAIRPLALRSVAAVCATVPVPVIGGGGVSSAADAQALLAVGATAVAIGSALLTDLRRSAALLE